MAANDRILVEFSGFEAGEEVHVELRSDPVRLGTFAANSLGVVSTFATVPSSFPSGSHALVAYVTTAEGGSSEPAALGSTGADAMPFIAGGVLMLLFGAAALSVARIRRGRAST